MIIPILLILIFWCSGKPTNQQQSIQLIGDASLNDNSLTRGKFVIRDEIGTRRFLAPIPTQPQGAKDGAVK